MATQDKARTPRAQAGALRFIADTLSGRLALVFTLLVLPPTIVSLYLAWDSYLEHKARAKLQVRQFATLTATYESKFFDDVQQTLQQVAEEDEAIRDGGGGACDEVLGTALERTPEFASLDYFNVEGRRICGSEDDTTDASNRGWFQEVRGFRGFAISDYTVPPNSPYPVIVAAQAVHDGDYRFQGVLAASIRLYWLSAFMHEVSLPPESVFYLIDRNGNILADRAAMQRDPGKIELGDIGSTTTTTTTGSASRLDSLAAVVGRESASAILERGQTDFEAEGPDGVRRVFSSVALPHGEVTVLFGMPAVNALGGVEKDLINRVLGLAAIWLAGVVAAWLGTRYLVTRWIARLRGLARAYGRGSYDQRPDFADAPRELRDLGETLSLMAHRIEVREEELRASLNQKDVVLREIHHRVKNNLQIVSSLLNIRGTGATGEAALNEVKAHVRALALVHRHLYESDDVQRVDLRSFMTELCQSMLTVLSGPSRRVQLDIEIPSFMIATDRAIPLALLVTEAMTNSLKHAFPDDRPGRITVAFESEGSEDGEAGTLTVADDGVGMSGAGMPAAGGAQAGIGLQLIEAFAKQIDATLEISGPPGTVIRVRLDGRAGAPPDQAADDAADSRSPTTVA